MSSIFSSAFFFFLFFFYYFLSIFNIRDKKKLNWGKWYIFFVKESILFCGFEVLMEFVLIWSLYQRIAGLKGLKLTKQLIFLVSAPSSSIQTNKPLNSPIIKTSIDPTTSMRTFHYHSIILLHFNRRSILSFMLLIVRLW